VRTDGRNPAGLEQGREFEQLENDGVGVLTNELLRLAFGQRPVAQRRGEGGIEGRYGRGRSHTPVVSTGGDERKGSSGG